MQQIKPCPWCGGEATTDFYVDAEVHYATCSQCHSCGPEKTEEPAAISAWNLFADEHRLAVEVLPEMVEALEQVEWLESRPGGSPRSCPICRHFDWNGHAPGCTLGNALAKARGK